MRGHHFCGSRAERALWHAAERFGRGPFGSGMRGGGSGGRRGGPGDFLRAGRMFGDGDLKLVVLYLMAEAPRHGYDIIKALEERSSGFYSPSPGVIYPTLTFLEEAGFAVSAPEGVKKVFSITEAGSSHLAENRDMVERALEQLERFGRKMAKAREWFGWDDDAQERRRGRKDDELRSVRRRLRAALAEILDGPEERRAEAVNILKGAAEALEALSRD